MSGTITGSAYEVPGYPDTVLAGVTDSGVFGSVSTEGFFYVGDALTLVNLTAASSTTVLGVNASGSTAYGEATVAGSSVYFVDTSGLLTVLPSGETPVGVDNAGAVLIDGTAGGLPGSPSSLLIHGVLVPIVVPGYTAEATAISPNGTLAGSIGSGYYPSAYFVGKPGTFTTYDYPDVGDNPLDPVDLGAPTAVNDAGETGFNNVTTFGLVYVVQDGQTLASYGDPYSDPKIVAINSSGDVLINDAPVGPIHGFYGVVLDPGVSETLVTASGFSDGAVVGLNDQGEIVGDGTVSFSDPTPASFTAQIPCFAAGTAIAIPGEERAVENLRIGDVVELADGGTASVIWLGHRRAAASELVRVRAGALAHGVPVRDLLVTADHALAFGCALVPAGLLVNEETIVHEAAAAVTVYHIELERHAILLANGAPAESYLDTGNRRQFANCPLHYDPSLPGGEPCGEMVFAGLLLKKARESLPTLVR